MILSSLLKDTFSVCKRKPCHSLHKLIRRLMSATSSTTCSTITGSNTTGSNTTGSNTTGSDTIGSTTTGSNTTGSNTTGSNTTGSDTTGSHTTGSDHLQRTADNTRHNVVSMATVIGMRDESKTVKGLTLKVHDRNLTFKPGQWVDMFIPGVDKVGGFSMCSSPGKLHEQGLMDLAVKYSDHPPAMWIHKKCENGSQVNIRAGGDVYYDPDLARAQEDLLLISGGVGVNPLYSMLCHVADLNLKIKGDNSLQNENVPGNVLFMYSASTDNELLFKEDICKMSEQHSNIKYQYFVTKQEICRQSEQLKCRRINEEDIEMALKSLRKDNLLVYICGPSPMINDIENILVKLGINKKQIYYENWW